MAADEDLEEILGGTRAELLHAEIFEHEQIDPRELLHEVSTRAGGFGFGEVRHQIERAADEGAVAGANRADGEGGRHVGFADAGRADEQDAGVRLDEARGGELDELRFWESWD